MAASMGHPKAIYNLGIFYVRGLGGLTRNRMAAAECFKMASKLGIVEAKQALEMKNVRRKANVNVATNINDLHLHNDFQSMTAV